MSTSHEPSAPFESVITTEGQFLPGKDATRNNAEDMSRMCNGVVAAYLCSCFLGWHDLIRVMLVLMGGGIALWRSRATTGCPAAKDSFPRLAGYFLCWMTARSLLEYGMLNPEYRDAAAWWMFGTFLLMLFGWLVWQAAKNPSALERAGGWTGLGAALAAAVSFILFYVVLPNHHIGERLGNWFIYGGLNPVNTGLTFGFAATWLVCRRGKALPGRERMLLTLALVILIAAVLFTRSRGALLALLAGHVALTLARGIRATVVPWTLLAVLSTLFILAGPLVNRLAAAQMAARAMQAEHLSVEHLVMQRMQDPTPAREMIDRKDSGRLQIYRTAISTLTQPQDWLFGVGQWGPGEFSSRKFGSNRHLHSAFFATLVHGGLVGLALLIAVLGIGFQRACQLARQADDVWLVLLTYGCTAMIFDGQTFSTLTSLPQMETLLVAFPVIAAASIGARRSS